MATFCFIQPLTVHRSSVTILHNSRSTQCTLFRTRKNGPTCCAPPSLPKRVEPLSYDKQVCRRQIVLQLSSLLLLAFNSSRRCEAALDYPELHGLEDKPDRGLPPFRTVNGIQIQDVTIGNEESPTVVEGTQVSIKYVLRRSNGYFIDASYGFDRFDTFSFRPNSGQVVKGFDQGVQGMHEGGRRRFVVPPNLGYVDGTGKNNPGPIPPDFGARRSLSAHVKENLIFEVSVVRIKPLATSSS